MSTELRNVPTTDILQTRFYGGEERGSCIQITQPFSSTPSEGCNLLQLTRREAQLVAQELLLFANKQEVEDEDVNDPSVSC